MSPESQIILPGLGNLLAQAAPELTPGQPASDSTLFTSTPIWQILLENALALTILFIFLTALVTIILSQRRRDKCLKYFHEHHVTYLTLAGKCIWGDLVVLSKGLEVVFDAPYRTARGFYKTSVLLYETDIAQNLAIFRYAASLDPRQARMRERQIHATFNPNIFRRTTRRIRNILNMLRDAFSKALSALIGAWAQTSKTTIVTTQKAGIEQIGQTILGVAGNAYEPLLERHIGKPVVLQLQSPASEDKAPIELPGFLADYSDTHVAVFNVKHIATQTLTLNVDADVTGAGYEVAWKPNVVRIAAKGSELLIIRSFKTKSRDRKPDLVLSHGCAVELPHDQSDSVTLEIELSQRLDVVCPRSQAIVYFGGQLDDQDSGSSTFQSQNDAGSPTRPQGMAPEEHIQTQDATHMAA